MKTFTEVLVRNLKGPDMPAYVRSDQILIIQPAQTGQMMKERYALLLQNGMTIECVGDGNKLVDELNEEPGTRGMIHGKLN